MDIVLFGIQGSGKGTQAKKLCADLGYRLFEAGGELRKIAASGTELGDTVKSYIDAGHLVPFDVIMNVVKGVVCDPSDKRPFIFDGIPRDVDQMRAFDEMMRDCKRDFRAIEITVNEEAAMRRILGRAKTEGRADDANEESIRRRMKLFHEKTEPVIAAYRAAGKVTDVDGEGSVDEVYRHVKNAVA